MSAITRYLAMLRLFGMLLCAAAIPSVATATVPVTVAVAASDVEEEAVEASAVGAEAEAARDAGYESAEVPALARRVTDLTATLDAAERARLEASLAALEARKGAQIALACDSPRLSRELAMPEVAEPWPLLEWPPRLPPWLPPLPPP